MGRFVKLNYVSISQTKDVIKEELSTELDDVVDSLNDPEKVRNGIWWIKYFLAIR